MIELERMGYPRLLLLLVRIQREQHEQERRRALDLAVEATQRMQTARTYVEFCRTLDAGLEGESGPPHDARFEALCRIVFGE